MSQPSTATSSQVNANLKNIKITERVQTLHSLMEEILLEYKTHGDVLTTFSSIKHLEGNIQSLFDDISTRKLGEDEIEQLTEICRKMNEDAHIQEVRYYSVEEKATEENIRSIPSLDNDKMARFARDNFPFETARKDQTDTVVLENTMPIPNAEPDSHVETRHDPVSNVEPNSHVETRQEESAKPTELRPDNEKVQVKGCDQVEEEIKIEGTSPVKIENKEVHAVRSEVKAEVPKPKPPVVDTEKESKRIRDELLKFIQHMKDEHVECKLDEAYNWYVRVRDFAKTRKLQKEDLEFYQSKLEENKKLIGDIETEHNDAQLILKELQDEEGYILESVKKNFVVKYKTGEGGLVSLKMEGIIDVPLFNMLALVYEMDCYNQWMPFTQDSKQLKQMTKASKAGWLKWKVPPPISNREAYIYGIGFNRLDVNGSVLIVSKSIHDDAKLAQKFEIDIPTNSKLSRIDLHYMGGAFYPISKDKIKVEIVTKFDAKIKFLPTSLVSWFVRKAAQFLFDILIKKATNFKGSIWEKRIQENREFYGWLEENLIKYLNAQEANAQQKK